MTKAPCQGPEQSPKTARPSPAEEGEDKDIDDSDRGEEIYSGKEPITKMSTWIAWITPY